MLIWMKAALHFGPDDVSFTAPLNNACYSGNFGIVQWLVESGLVPQDADVGEAIDMAGGYPDIEDWVRKRFEFGDESNSSDAEPAQERGRNKERSGK